MTDKQTADQNDATVFMAEYRASAAGIPSARLIYLDHDALQGLEIILSDQEQTIGRSEENSVPINSKKISRHHARIYPQDQEWVIEDLMSTNGVFVNDERVKKAVLRHGNLVKIGPFAFRYALDQPPEVAATPPVSEMAVSSEETIYGGQPGVIDRLTPQVEEANVPPKPRPYEPPKVLPAGGRGDARRWRPSRNVLLGLAGGLVIGAVIVFSLLFRELAIDHQIDRYAINFRHFIDAAENTNIPAFQEELVEIRKLASLIDSEADQYPAIDCQGEFATRSTGCKLRDLQASVLFLAFERWLEAFVEEGRINQAERLVEKTDELVERAQNKQGFRILPEFEDELAELLKKPGEPGDKPPEQQLYTVFNNVRVQPIPQELPGKGSADSAFVPSSEEVHELLKLAGLAVEFKLFKKAFPDPDNATVTGWPDRGNLANLQDKKREFGKRMRAKNPVLSGTFKYFDRLLKSVNDKDVNLIDRWSLKRPQP